MGTNDVAVWERTWGSIEGQARPAWQFIFDEIASRVCFEGKEVLEMGCGKGSLSFFALKAGANHVTLVDFSETALGLARQLFRYEDPRRVAYARANLLDVDLGRRFDIVMSSGVVEHFFGGELEASIRQHVRHSRDKVVLCVPSDTVFNRRRSSAPQNIAAYGYWRPVPDRRMKELLQRENVTVLHNRRFRVNYGMNLPGGRLPAADRVHQLVFMCLGPLERWLGGLLLTIGGVAGPRARKKDKQ